MKNMITLAKIGVALMALTPTGAWNLRRGTKMLKTANEMLETITKEAEEE